MLTSRTSFQEVQRLSAFDSALRFLPSIVIGIILNFGTGLLVHRISANYLILISTFLSAIAPLLMALIRPEWSFWICAFWAMLAVPLSADGTLLCIARGKAVACCFQRRFRLLGIQLT